MRGIESCLWVLPLIYGWNNTHHIFSERFLLEKHFIYKRLKTVWIWNESRSHGITFQNLKYKILNRCVSSLSVTFGQLLVALFVFVLIHMSLAIEDFVFYCAFVCVCEREKHLCKCCFTFSFRRTLRLDDFNVSTKFDLIKQPDLKKCFGRLFFSPCVCTCLFFAQCSRSSRVFLPLHTLVTWLLHTGFSHLSLLTLTDYTYTLSFIV